MTGGSDPRRESKENVDAATTVHVAAAQNGDSGSIAWLFERFSPWLLAQARLRLPATVQRRCTPEDVVHDVWVRALPVLPTLQARAGRLTPVLMKFLSTTLLYRSNELIRWQIRQRAAPMPSDTGQQPGAATRGVLTRVADDDACRSLLDAVEQLGEPDRRILLMRLVESRAVAEVAGVLGLTANAVSLRFGRALQRLRERLGPSLLDDLGAPDEKSREA